MPAGQIDTPPEILSNKSAGLAMPHLPGETRSVTATGSEVLGGGPPDMP
jgi:hypothetical protein